MTSSVCEPTLIDTEYTEATLVTAPNVWRIENAKIVLPDVVIDGDVTIEKGHIVAIDAINSKVINSAITNGKLFINNSFANKDGLATLDFAGDYLLPGLVELHTDNLEKHFMPRPKVVWPGQAAVIAHDAQLISAGITTVFNAVSVGEISDKHKRVANLRAMLHALQHAYEQGLLRAEHHVHLRCELCYPEMLNLFDELLALVDVGLVSLMDHSPGQRQFANVNQYKIYYQGKFGFSDTELNAFMQQQIKNSEQYSHQHRHAVVSRCHDRGIPLMSHDDATSEHVQEALDLGVVMAEFPTTKVAAHASHQAGLGVLMGAPNVVRGGSHSGNIAAHELASAGVLDILSSDYCPTSLLHAAFILAERPDNDYDLSKAVNTISHNPAKFAGFTDRGSIETNKRADLLRVGMVNDAPYLKRAWVQGELVF